MESLKGQPSLQFCTLRCAAPAPEALGQASCALVHTGPPAWLSYPRATLSRDPKQCCSLTGSPESALP